MTSRRRRLHILLPIVIAVLFGSGIITSQTAWGDEFRFRPVWMLALSYLVPRFELRANWFLRGDEEDYVKEGLAVLVKSLNEEAELTGIGRMLAFSVLLDETTQLHCVSDAIKEAKLKSSSSSSSVADSPVIVLGLPRTGTTFLHELLSADAERFRSPKFHEYMDACPKPASFNPDSWYSKFRIAVNHVKAYAIRILVPTLSALHHIDAETAEEDVVPLGQVFVSALYPTTFHVPSYTKWLMSHPDYFERSLRYLKDYLEYHLRFPRDERQFLLKTPWHIAQVEALTRVFPGARYVWTHRDPAEQASSCASVVLAMNGLGSDDVKSPEMVRRIANETTEYWMACFKKGWEERERLSPFVADISFRDLNADPLAAAKRIYKVLRLPSMSSASQEIMEAYARSHPRGKYGGHHHTLEAFGMKPDAIRSRYRRDAGYDYREYVGEPVEVVGSSKGDGNKQQYIN